MTDTSSRPEMPGTNGTAPPETERLERLEPPGELEEPGELEGPGTEARPGETESPAAGFTEEPDAGSETDNLDQTVEPETTVGRDQIGGLQEADSSQASDGTAEEEEKQRKRRDLRHLRQQEWVVLGALILLVALIGFNLKPVRVLGSSMEPTFHSGEIVIVWRTAPLFSSLRVGDVIVFRAEDGQELIKRIAFIQSRDGKKVMPVRLWTPGGWLPVPLLLAGAHRFQFPGYEQSIQLARQGIRLRKTLYVLGDNTWYADDSRHFGPIDPSTVLGTVIAVIGKEHLPAHRPAGGVTR